MEEIQPIEGRKLETKNSGNVVVAYEYTDETDGIKFFDTVDQVLFWLYCEGDHVVDYTIHT